MKFVKYNGRALRMLRGCIVNDSNLLESVRTKKINLEKNCRPKDSLHD